MKIKYITVIALLLFASCNKFLDVAPKGIIMPAKLADFEGVLYSNAITTGFNAELLYITDDLYFYTLPSNETVRANLYLWREYINVESQTDPNIWGPLYNSIYHANIVINGVLNAKDGSEQQKRQLYNEALVIRAYCYMDLLTVFAKAYHPATAASDPGLPMVTSNDVGEKTPSRSSVKTVLESISADLAEAATGLPGTSINKYRSNKYVAYALLSRIALYKGDYDAAKDYAEQALTAPHTKVNYNNFTAATIPKTPENPEVLFMRSGKTANPQVELYSEDLVNVFDSQNATRPFTESPDLRFRYFTTSTTAGLQRAAIGEGVSSSFGIRFTEMELTVAEVLARSGDDAGAMMIVNELRKNRIVSAAYTDQTAVDAEDALSKVLAERRRELAFGGLRWFDMKRLDAEGRMPEVLRINKEQPNTPREQIASLPPGSPRYTFQIPYRILLSNPNMIKN